MSARRHDGGNGLERRLQPAQRPAGPRAVRCCPRCKGARSRATPAHEIRLGARLRRAVPAEAGAPSRRRGRFRIEGRSLPKAAFARKAFAANQFAGRAYRMLRQQLRISTAPLSDAAKGAPSLLNRGRILIESRVRDVRRKPGRARLSDVAPATSDKHRPLIGKGAPSLLNRGRILIESRVRDVRRKPGRARLSDVAPATSDKHRPLIGCRERRAFTSESGADPYRKPRSRSRFRGFR